MAAHGAWAACSAIGQAEFIAKEIHKGTLLTCLRNAPDSSKLYGYLCSILTVVTTCPLWSRYMREHPDQASPVLAHLATFLVRNIPPRGSVRPLCLSTTEFSLAF